MENDLGNDNIRRLVLRIALPSMLAQFVSVFYSIIDRMYIGHIKDVGDLALGGVGVCGPVVTMVGAFAFLVGMGGAPLMSIRLGEGHEEEAKKIVANGFLALCVCAIVLPIMLLMVKRPMLELFGAGETIYPFAEKYFTIYILGTIAALPATGMNQFIIAQGFAKYGMLSVMTGAVVNIILDPIFIFGLNLGVSGAAAATVISQVCSCVLVLKFLFSSRAAVKISFRGYSLRIIRSITKLGLSPFLIIAVDNLMLVAMNMILQKYGGPAKGDMLVTCGTIAQSFMLVVTMPLGGITGGTQTILSYNYGANKKDRVMEAQKAIFQLCTFYMAVMFLFARFGSPLFVRIFTSDTALMQQAVQSIHMLTTGIIFLGIQYEIIDGFTALGKVEYALSLSFFRKIVYFVCLFTMPLFLPIEKVFYAEAVSDLIPPVISFVVYKMAIRKCLEKRI